jgi:DNA repair protein RAD7
LTDEDEAARKQFEESHAPIPAQTDNCEICEKRFTVTGYSRKGEDGGLLCPKCSKELDKEKGVERKRQKTAQGRQRRQIQSNLLDGIYPGAKDLMTICIETLAKNVDIADDLGDLPDTMVDRLSSILSKRRLMNSTTLNLFLKIGKDTINIYEGATLTADDYIRVFQWTPTVKNLLVKDGIQFKNKVMDHLIDCPVKLESFSIHGSNLIDDERWDRFLTVKGSYLKALKVYYTDGHFGDEQLELLPKTCPDLQVLKVSHNQKVTDAGIAHIANLTKLQKLTLQIYNPTTSEPYAKIIDSIGANLRTLCLSAVHTINDTVLESIHNNCQNLIKLRITDNEVLSDSAFASLFTNWSNPPLTYVDFSKCRHIDASDPRTNPDGVGLGSLGFLALMNHSAKYLRYLDIHSCRHISLATFEEVFDPAKTTYPELKKMNLSFCSNVNDYVVAAIFKCCPNIETLVTFGNFGVRDVRVPKGKILIGVPTAMGMQIEGTADGEGRVI